MGEGDTRFDALRLVSADSHVIEPVGLWQGLLPSDYWDQTPETFFEHPGGFEPSARIREMEADSVSAEVLYPSRALKLFAHEDATMQQTCFARYNNWLAEFCGVAGSRLVGIGAVATYNIEHAVAEARRCAALGLRGILVWQSPHANVPFSSSHYDPLWAVCEELELPVSMHIMSGFDYSQKFYRNGVPKQTVDILQLAVSAKLQATMDALIALMFSGVFDRFRRLKLVLVESEAGWLPHFVDQLDYYYTRFRERSPQKLERLPSQCFAEQIFATFFRDRNVSTVLARLGTKNVMWSSDYPHGNSTWPKSRQVVRENLASLSDADLDAVTSSNCMRLYRMTL
jgi:uncharacterized protein